MTVNPDWNYGYLRSNYAGDALLKDPITAIADATGTAFKATGAAVTSIYTYKTAREQAAADEKAARIAMRQQAGQANAGWENLLLFTKQQEEAKRISGDTAAQTAAQSEAVKTVILGLVAIGVVGALGYAVYVATKD